MAIFEYCCNNCGAIEEIRCPFIYNEEVLCPYCFPENKMERIISSGGFRLKGDGYYKPSED